MDDPLGRLNNQVNSAADRLHRQTAAAVIIVGISELPEGGRGVSYSVQGPTNYQTELALMVLLRALEQQVAGCAVEGCADCGERHTRVTAAISALEPGFPQDGRPQGSC